MEEFSPGREFCVGILGNEDARTLPIAEVLTEGDFYSYEDKSAHKKEILCPAELPEETAREMRTIALKVYGITRCHDLARIDFKMDRHNRISFLEINPLPGLADTYSIFPVQARAAGIDYTSLIGEIIELARKRAAFHKESEV